MKEFKAIFRVYVDSDVLSDVFFEVDANKEIEEVYEKEFDRLQEAEEYSAQVFREIAEKYLGVDDVQDDVCGWTTEGIRHCERLILKKSTLPSNRVWELRSEIVAGSLYLSDYENSLGVDADEACEFFEDYVSFIREEAAEIGVDAYELDSPEMLEEWYGFFNEAPLHYWKAI